jgi:hypothetical protein
MTETRGTPYLRQKKPDFEQNAVSTKNQYPFGSGLAAAHARQLKGLGLYGEGLSRRDSVKVAQYEVLGNEAKRHVRPVRDDRKARGSHAAERLPAFIDRPVRDG